jgi:hypothetical protein
MAKATMNRDPLIASAAANYVSANAGWPKRTEACDKSS